MVFIENMPVCVAGVLKRETAWLNHAVSQYDTKMFLLYVAIAKILAEIFVLKIAALA